jgi:hypothetical protein
MQTSFSFRLIDPQLLNQWTFLNGSGAGILENLWGGQGTEKE